jgi:hypothetical protein
VQGRQRTVLLGLAALVVVVAVIVAIASGGGDGDDETATTTVRGSTLPTIVIRSGKPVGGVRTLQFNKGGTIAFAVRSDEASEIHFHGYDIAKDVAAGVTVRYAVPAKIDGRFEVEIEDTGTQIATVEVLP